MSTITSHFKIHSTSAGTLGASAVLCVNVLEANLDLYLVRLEFHLLKHQHIEDQQKWPREYCHCAKGLRGALRHPVSSLWGLCHGNGVSTVRRQFGESHYLIAKTDSWTSRQSYSILHQVDYSKDYYESNLLCKCTVLKKKKCTWEYGFGLLSLPCWKQNWVLQDLGALPASVSVCFSKLSVSVMWVLLRTQVPFPLPPLNQLEKYV